MAIRLIALCDENITITGNMKFTLGRQFFKLQQWNKFWMIICKTGGWEEEAPLNGQPVPLTSQHVTISCGVI